MGVVSTHTMVTGTSSGGFVGYFASLGVGSMSPSTTDCLGTSPAISSIYYAFGFTVFEVTGTFDNSSIVSMTLTPSGGSSTTFTFNSHVQSSGVTRFSTSSGSALSNNTTYTVQINGDTTDVNTERATLERRTPTGLDDFFGATRNVQPISGVMKLSYLHDAVKRQWTSTLTAARYIETGTGYNYHGYALVYPPSLGSMTNLPPSGLINLYNGKTLVTLYNLYVPSNPSYNIMTMSFQTSTDGSVPGSNSQWYKLQVGSTSFYREDATYSYNTNSPYFTTFSWNTGSSQTIVYNNTYTIKLTC